MSTVNVRKSETEDSIILFDNFYKQEIKINGAEYDHVRQYFLSLFTDKNIADDFTATVFLIATGYNRNAIEILEELKGQDGIEVNATIAYYLNGLRSKATLLGVTVVQQPNIYAARNVQV